MKEIFYTLQGEGINAGRVAVFCRFSGCNLWTGREADRHRAVCQFCDTDFVGVGPDGGKFATAEELADAVAAVIRSEPAVVLSEPAVVLSEPAVVPSEPAVVLSEPAVVLSEPALILSEPAVVLSEPALIPSEPAVVLSEARDLPLLLQPRLLVVCTGGEPLLQLDDAAVAALHARGFEVAVETNGTQPAPAGVDWICVSPKSNAALVLTRGNELKLVYPQLQPDAQPERFAQLAFDHFLLQPMDGPDLARNTQLAIAYCLAHPQWRLSVQTHKTAGIR